MIDFHSHILPELDDGSRSIEETINLIKEAKKVGFTKIIATSHYIQDEYEFDVESREKFLEMINKGIKDLEIDIELYLGSEIYVDYNMLELIQDNKASTINNSKYILFELPMRNEIPNLKNIIYNLLGNKYVPIIAHPERYEYVKKNPNWLLEFLELGVLFQANFGSVLGMYGKHAEKTVKLLLKNNMIHFLGSDVHRQNSIYNNIPEALHELNKIVDKKMIRNLTDINAQLVLENKPIYTEMPTKIKKGFWGI